MKVAEITFDADGKLVGSLDDLIRSTSNLKHLIFHSHGFNNDAKAARDIGGGYFDKMVEVLETHGTPQANNTNTGHCLVLWPSVADFTHFGEMAARAEKIGKHGLADVVNRVKKALTGLNIHLLLRFSPRGTSCFELCGMDRYPVVT